MSQALSMPTPPPLRDDPAVRETYVDGPVGVNFFNGNLHITLWALRSDHSVEASPQYRQVVARLVIPLAGAIDLQNTISSIMTMLQSQGVIQPIMPGPTTRQ
jgi:hypothetical protein